MSNIIDFATAKERLKKVENKETAPPQIFSYTGGGQIESFEKDTRGIKSKGLTPSLAFVIVNQNVLPDPFPPDFDPYTPRAA